MLLEIYFDRPIHSIRNATANSCSVRSYHVEHAGDASVINYTAIAFEWVRRKRKNMSAVISDAVKHCITC